MMDLGLTFIGLGTIISALLYFVPSLFSKETFLMGFNGIVVGAIVCSGSILADAVPKLQFVLWGLVVVLMVWTVLFSVASMDLRGAKND